MKFPHLPALHYGNRLRPSRDWRIVLILSGLLLALSVGANLWLFEHVVEGGVLGDAPNVTSNVFSQQSLEEIEKIFAEREAEEGKYKFGTYNFIDPSK